MLLPPMGFRFGMAASGIERLTSQIIEELRTISDAIAAIPAEKRSSWESTLLAWHERQGWAATMQTQCTLPAMVGGDADARAASSRAGTELRKCWEAIYSRSDLYSVFRGLRSEGRPEQDSRLLSLTLSRFEANGAALDDGKRAAFVALRNEISELEARYVRNLNEDTTSVTLTAEDLEGCSPTFLSSLRRDGDRYIVTMKPPDVRGVLLTAARSSARQRVLETQESRCLDANLPLLERILRLRAEAAALVGFPNHAAYRIKPTVAATVQNVSALLTEVMEKVKPKYQEERAQLLELKRKHLESRGESFDGKLHMWDMAYYMTLLSEQVGNYDKEKMKEYFPVEHVRDQIFRVYEEVLQLRIAPAEPPLPTWHEDVTSYMVLDARRAADDPEALLGYFYLDILPRDGKYSHQCVVPICPTYVRANGSRQFPVAANLGNMPRGTGDTPGLLYHSQVVTFFHEFGHVLHALCTRSDASLLSWAWSVVPYPAGVEHDYLEVPSQMFENWTWDADVLRRLSCHYRTKEPLPDDMIEGLRRARKVGDGYRYVRQITMSQIDMLLHTDSTAAANAAQVARQMLEENLQLETVGCFLASWYHIVQGYDAGYYGYLWSEVYSHDVYSAFPNAFDTATGVRYRDLLLAPGATRPALDMIRAFLGREPSSEAFFKSL